MYLIYFEVFLCMVLGTVLISFFYTQLSSFLSTKFIEEVYFLIHCIFLPPLSKIRCTYMRQFFSGLSILFYWSVFLFFCQNHTVSFFFHTVLITVALLQSEVKKVIRPAPLFLRFHLQFSFVCVSFHTNFEMGQFNSDDH